MLRGLLAASAASAVTICAPASFADEREQCAAAAEHGQTLLDEGKYSRAREQMLLCARDVCPGPIKSDCGKWLERIERESPTVVFGAKDGGKDVTDVKVSVDGAVVTERLDGKPLLVDAGEHTFAFEHGGVVKEERVLVRAAEKGRPITVTFDAPSATRPEAPPPSTADEPSIVPALVVGGIGVVAIGSFALFGLQGRSDVDDLEKCKPRCAERDVDAARTKLIIADISLGVGVVALAVSTYMILSRPKVPDRVDVRASKAAPPRRAFMDVRGLPGGGAFALGGTF